MSCGMDYAQARIQARFGGRPGAALWRELEGIRDLPSYLEAARSSPLRGWVSGIEASGGLPQIETRLRERLRSHIREVAGWVPPPWKPAVLWLSQLLDLPALAHLLSGHAPLPWMSREQGLQGLIADGPRAALAAPRVRHPSRGGASRGRLGAATPDPGQARSSWLAEWERRWPEHDAEAFAGMRGLVATMSVHLEHFKRASARESWQMRVALERELHTLFRRFTLSPQAAFAYLGLIALDLERLRAGLVRRALWEREGVAA